MVGDGNCPAGRELFFVRHRCYRGVASRNFLSGHLSRSTGSTAGHAGSPMRGKWAGTSTIAVSVLAAGVDGLFVSGAVWATGCSINS